MAPYQTALMIMSPESAYVSGDEFSTSTSLLSDLTWFVRHVFDESRSRSAQSVRPFVQSSSCYAGYGDWFGFRNVPEFKQQLVRRHGKPEQITTECLSEGQTRLKLNSDRINMITSE
jgi:hypothetical protein